MKSLKYLSIIILLTCITIPVHSQFRYGVKGGMNISTLHFNKDVVDPDYYVGYHAGFLMEYIFPKLGIGMELAPVFSQKGIGFHSKNYQTHYIEIPLNFKWKYGLPFGKAYFLVGPYLGLAVGNKTWDRISTTGSPQVTAEKMDTGINAGIGVEIFNHLQVGVGYAFGLIDSHQVKRSSGTTTYAQNRNLFISAAYLF